MTLSRKQNAVIHVARNQLGITDAEYRAILVQLTGATSSKDLDKAGFETVMGYFEYLGFSPRVPYGQDFGQRPGMASFAQLELIRVLWAEYTANAYQGREDELNKWLLRCFKVSNLRFLTARAAPRVITALKAMKARTG